MTHPYSSQPNADSTDQLRPMRIARLEERPDPASVFRITVLCTGNRFRSPIAAAVIETLTEGMPVGVRSLGTKHVGTVGAMPEAIEAGAHLGIDVTGHIARLATPSDVAHADLVLGFELSHLARARQLGAPTAHVFTLPGLANVVERLSFDRIEGEGFAERARRIVALAHRNRHVPGESLREIRDPAGVSTRRAFSIARDVHYNASIVVGYLFDTAPTTTPGGGQERGYPVAGA